jgi:5-methylcytosine-specific restriction endonuclease McrA
VPNRRLTAEELSIANSILESVRTQVEEHSRDDPALRFALRRKIYKELVYDERSKPVERVKLKKHMRQIQNGLCALCKQALPDKYIVLDRFNAIDGYVPENVRLICEGCDRQVQVERRYS